MMTSKQPFQKGMIVLLLIISIFCSKWIVYHSTMMRGIMRKIATLSHLVNLLLIINFVSCVDSRAMLVCKLTDEINV
jgi:hypothetical protein